MWGNPACTPAGPPGLSRPMWTASLLLEHRAATWASPSLVHDLISHSNKSTFRLISSRTPRMKDICSINSALPGRFWLQVSKVQLNSILLLKCGFISTMAENIQGCNSWLQAPLAPWGQVAPSGLCLSPPLWPALLMDEGLCWSLHKAEWPQFPQGQQLMTTGNQYRPFPRPQDSPFQDGVAGWVVPCEWLSFQRMGRGFPRGKDPGLTK